MDRINFKKWAFHFIIWVFIINIISFYLTVNYVNISGVENNTGLTIFFFAILASILLLLGIIFIIISTIKKEKRNYQFWISVIGVVLFGILPLVSSFLMI